jgi:hypothetical protein
MLYAVLAASIVLAVAQQFAFAYFLYWRFWWFDVLMHFGGGLVCGLMARAMGLKKFTHIVAVVLSVGVMWEVYEVVIGISMTELRYTTDTAKDLAMDIFGVIVAYGIIHWWDQQYPSPLPEEHVESLARIS